MCGLVERDLHLLRRVTDLRGLDVSGSPGDSCYAGAFYGYDIMPQDA
jgi:hypothetical protein